MPVRGPSGQEILVNAVIDTGFTDFLTLPVQLVPRLALPFAATMRATLGHGSNVDISLFTGTVTWDNQDLDVGVLAMDGGPPVGMALPSGYRVTLDVEDGGAVRIEALR